jgi:NAD(P)H-hydrate repair Nnr-like enzyme with NAD(P)H-hydrate dehydratase domain
MIAGLVAQHPGRAFEAVIAAVYLHGLSGDIACYELGPIRSGEQCLVATDIIQAMPRAFRQARARAAEKWVRIGGQRFSGFSGQW